jgi:hypothetical protein
MKKFLLLIWTIFTGFFTLLLCSFVVDVFFGGGCTRTANNSYEPALLSQVWSVVSYIYTWAPEGSSVRQWLQILAVVLTIMIPAIVAVYMFYQFKDLVKKYREL